MNANIEDKNISKNNDISNVDCIVKLVIKNPYCSLLADVSMDFHFDSNTTVTTLKQQIECEYPTNPAVNQQRLIYFGKLLTDNQPIKSIFCKANLEQAQTLHMLVPINNVLSKQQNKVNPATNVAPVKKKDDDEEEEEEKEEKIKPAAPITPSLDEQERSTRSFNYSNSYQSYPFQQQQQHHHFSDASQQYIHMQQAIQQQRQLYYQQYSAYAANYATVSGLAGVATQESVIQNVNAASNLPSIPAVDSAKVVSSNGKNSNFVSKADSASNPTSSNFDFPSDVNPISGVSALAYLQEEENDNTNGNDHHSHSLDQNPGALNSIDSIRNRNIRNINHTNNQHLPLPNKEYTFKNKSMNKDSTNEKPMTYQDHIDKLEKCYSELMTAINTSQRLQSMMMFQMQAQQDHFYNYYNYTTNSNPYFTNFHRQSNVHQGQQQNHHHQEQNVNNVEEPDEVAEPNAREAQPADDGARAAVAAAMAGQQQRQNVVVGRVIVINIRLIIKLTLLIYFLNNDTSSPTFYSMLVLAGFYYLWATGYFNWILGNDAQQAELSSRINLRLQEMGHISPTQQVSSSLFTESYYLLKTFVLSLLPFYRVSATSESIQPAAAEAIAAEPPVVEQN